MPSMTMEEALAFIAVGTRTGKLATSSPSGDPHVAPLWFVVDDGIVFTTGHDTVKGRHLRANPRAALAVDDDTFPYGFVVVRGPVEVDIEVPAKLDWATRIAERYVPAGRAPEYGQRNAVPEEMVCRLAIERITGFRDIAL